MWFRVRYAARLRSGGMERRLPARTWDQIDRASLLIDPDLAHPEAYLDHRCTRAPAFFFDPVQRATFQPLFAQWDEDAGPVQEAEEVAAGRLRYFAHDLYATGFPPDWHKNVVNGGRAPADVHWSRISEMGHGDIKLIWEPSRFAFVYLLARAYWRTGDERHAETFWQLVEDWLRRNPPQLGPNWMCGQETSFRVMAWCFGLHAFLQASATTPMRVATLAKAIAVSGARIAANVGYAVSQQNNHGISEGMGLWTIGLLFPEFREAAAWWERGREILEHLGRKLIYEDGSFVQHSLNYHRLMLDDYLWALRLDDLNMGVLSGELRRRVALASAFLAQLQDESSGRVPNYGSNDGALILPLTNTDYRDFRPVVQAMEVLTTGQRRLAPGPWDEKLLWLFGPDALSLPLVQTKQPDLSAGDGGYYILHGDQSWVFTRCASFRHRPGQADALHVDLWWRRHNLALDAGTYSYNEAPPWDNALAHSVHHNTVTVDQRDQMDRLGKFLWAPWLRAQVRTTARSKSGRAAFWEGEHDGYQRLQQPVWHRRALVQLPEDTWLVLDYLTSPGSHDYRLHWLLDDNAWTWEEIARQLTLETPSGPYHVQVGGWPEAGTVSLLRADETGARGWHAPYYQARQPAISMALVASGANQFFWTLFSACPANLLQKGPDVSVEGCGWRADIDLSEHGAAMIRHLKLSGSYVDDLCLD